MRTTRWQTPLLISACATKAHPGIVRDLHGSCRSHGLSNPECRYGQQFFPGTGDMDEIGVGPGKYTSINLPLKDGIDDEGYMSLFKPVMRKVIEV